MYSQKGVDVSQSQESKTDAAQGRSEETRSFVRTVKAATRRKYTPEEKIRIVLEGSVVR
jgi:GH25 family lysozyme M1 (1,4-beta-N-acetylmuramidase)